MGDPDHDLAIALVMSMAENSGDDDDEFQHVVSCKPLKVEHRKALHAISANGTEHNCRKALHAKKHCGKENDCDIHTDSKNKRRKLATTDVKDKQINHEKKVKLSIRNAKSRLRREGLIDNNEGNIMLRTEDAQTDSKGGFKARDLPSKEENAFLNLETCALETSRRITRPIKNLSLPIEHNYSAIEHTLFQKIRARVDDGGSCLVPMPEIEDEPGQLDNGACNTSIHVPIDDDFLSDQKPVDELEEVISLAESDTFFDTDTLTGEQKTQHCSLSSTQPCAPSRGGWSNSQFSALLKLCVDTMSEDSGAREHPLTIVDNKDSMAFNDCASPIVPLESEVDITSIMTQQRFIRIGFMVEDRQADCEGEFDKEALVITQETNCDRHKCSQVAVVEPLECPICGSSILDMTNEQRQLHTNACFDHSSLYQAEAASATESTKPNETVELFDASPVLRWLESLNLSRYADIFVREEIDWDTLNCLSDEDLNTLGIKALGPRRKILYALQELRKGKHQALTENALETSIDTDANTSSAMHLLGTTRITDFFALPQSCRRSHPVNQQVPSKVGASKGVMQRKIPPQIRGAPEWMCIPGTKFRVDAFQYLRSDCSHWFLTHFHTDHYQGLTRCFRYGHVYCSPITADLVASRIGVPWERLRPLPLNEPIGIDGVRVTFIDANHCPGSVMVLFELQNGEAILHTGDFRFCEEMANNVLLRSCNIQTLMLDTTYCNPQYDFPKQEVVIQFIIDAIQAEAFNPNTLFLIGTYTIGKERIFFEVAKVLRKKVYVSATKLRLLHCMKFLDEDMQWLTTNEHEACIHVVPLWTIASFKRMKFVSQQYLGKYSTIVSFSPTGWSFGRGKRRMPGKRWQQGSIIRYEVPYSEHCSFKELREFVRFITPQNIVPSVNNESPETADALVALLLSEEEPN